MQDRVNLHPRRPVHVKLAILLMVSLVVVLGGSFVYTSYMARDSFRYDLDNRVARLETYAELLTEPVAQGRQEQIEAILDLVMDEADTLRLEILNAQVQPLTERLSSDFGRVQVESRFVIPLISGREMGEEAGWFIAEVSAQTLYLAERERLEDTFLTLILVAVALSAALFIFQARVVNRPLRELLFAIQQARETGDFIRAKLRDSGDEFGIIISSYNELLDELDNKHNSLKESEARFRNLYNQTPALLFTLLPDGRIQSVSEHFLIHLGFNERDIVGRSIAHLACDEKELNTLRDELKQVAPDTSSECYLQVRDRAGEVHSMRINLTANPQGQGALAVMTDITSLDEALSTIERQANFDSLTTLPNRHFFKLMLAEQLTSDQSLEQGLALLFIDLDRFKYINDTHGHHTGDKLLAAAGQRIQHHLPAGDFVARLGGDEFAVLLHGRKEEAALLQLAEGIVEELERPFEIDERRLHISASIGIVVHKTRDTSADSLLRSADLAMYRAKEEGRSRARVFLPEDEERTRKRMDAETLVRDALANDWFELHYQPVVYLKSQRVVGAEALIRLRHPERGLLFPGDFIDVAEETGLIVQVGEWVLREGLRQLATWHQRHHSQAYLSINVSGQQFMDSRFVDLLREVLEAHEIAPGYLILEITESMLMHNTAHTLDVMNALKRLGCLLSIDDFGTGYSSLSYLQKFPLDILKIDRSFVMDIEENQTHHALVGAIVTMSRALNLKVITEGVETQQQLECLQALRCELGQGYFFSRPIPAGHFIARYLSDPEHTHVGFG